MQRAAWAGLVFFFVAMTASANGAPPPLGLEESVTPPGIIDVGPVTVFGRVEARAGASDDKEWSRDYEARAIFGVDFSHGDWLKGQVEMQVSVFPELRDAWLRAKLPGRMSLQVGRFRPPFGRLEQTSKWDLPLVRRGAVSEQAQDELGYGGRRMGLMLKAKAPKGFGRANIALGAFEGDALADGSRAEDLVARATGDIASWLSIGAGTYVRGAFRQDALDRYLVGVDALITLGGFEWVGEVQAGPEFFGATVLAAWRAEFASMPGWWLQPAVSAELVGNGLDALRPLLTPTLNAGWNGFRGRVAVELGSGRQAVGSTRIATLLVFLGCEF